MRRIKAWNRNMGKFQIPAKDPKHTVFVGWDQPQRTYFAQVGPVKDPVTMELTLWVGNSFGEIRNLDALQEAIKDYAEISDVDRARLLHDRDEAKARQDARMWADILPTLPPAIRERIHIVPDSYEEDEDIEP
jgi:hypothetical protein